MLQHRLCLLPTHAGKPLEKIIQPCTLFQIRKECLDGHARPSEDPRSADLLRIPLNSSALIPIERFKKRLLDESVAGKLVTPNT
jgi:hypothetical protein